MNTKVIRKSKSAFGGVWRVCGIAAALALGIGTSHAQTPLFSVDHDDLGAVGASAAPWGVFNARNGSPTVVELAGEKWMENKRDTSDRLRHSNGGYGTTPIAINGATIVTAIMPERHPSGNPWTSVVDIFYDQLCIGVLNETGQIKVKISGANAANPTWTSAADKVIPEFERGVLTLVVGPEANPAFEVFWRPEGGAAEVSLGTGNGNTGGQPYTNLYPSANGRGYAQYVNIGGNDPDGWPVFNGFIGDTYVYGEQLSGQALLDVQNAVYAAMSLDTPLVSHTITASGNIAGGTIDPAGAITVLDGNDETFNITTDYGYVLTDVLVDSVSQGAITEYSFTNVTEGHTIEAIWAELETISGTVTDSATTDPIYSALVSLSTNSDGSSPSQTVASNAAGEYVIAVDDPNLTYYLIARKGGHVTSAVKTVAMSGSSVPGEDFVLVQSAGLDPLVDLDASALSNGALTSWTNTGSLGGSFDSFDGTSTPTVTTVGGLKAVQFTQATDQAADRETLVGTVPTPLEIAGASDWTISTVLYRAVDQQGGENCYMCWSGRDISGGQPWPAAQYRTAQFCYRDNTAAIHYGADYGFSPVPSGGEWHNVTITYDGVDEILYVDGVEDETRTWTLNLKPDTMMMVGGAYWDGNDSETLLQNRQQDQYWRYHGSIASLRIYDQALTPEEVGSISGLPTNPNDIDGDGLLDSWELSFPGIVDLTYLNGNASGPGPGIGTGDFDGDGTSDAAEERLGLIPNDPTSNFAATIVRDGVTGNVTLSWPSQMDLEFDVLWTDNLSDPLNTWLNLGPITDTDGGPSESYTDTGAAPEDVGYYVIELK